MKDSGRSPLVKLFLTSYEDFKVRLRRRLGSEELANDVLHETYLRVDRMVDTQEIAQPNAYLYRMALNIAADRRQADARLLTGDEIEELLQVSDEALDPARVVGGQKELQTLLKALYELPARRRRIFIAARLEEAPHLEISQRFGISTRMVEKEIKAALGHCALRLERKVIQRFGPGAGKPS
ncbi:MULTISPECIES: sigma-70 family RNA polymerase sigma factor [Pseudomonas]|jgi:RNA polymerase sigma-70 factor (ECF subfamily)|uniref:RNA polymerase subunit sigma-24 n=1 Tax=Pseudomonas ogarae (strain DSM 112162 / CECT 30235 / F113) TaxID=1114970 RepID=A0ABM6R219_PSEO1|nr:MULTISPECIES: sigma-70 family RNA polymerase sigma factor [Pseudomonas]AXP02967.1 sigma-70 family RNA polymerase sigma factor [Pseudomonas fluorescens]AUO47527.1 RNA polymerase subunit sigma-24 [Pseudomonas ogarae]MCD9114433.1 sigma-70 family RNA polymerase sigma factor [Pseudomonas bijieensis]PWJ30133.1 RNA polymerase sigma-70 factor (ECF subfamily) [Pseudomonas sp. 43mfcvi1.1]QIB03358.1 sigma-70 family RNA polymerase sigma factor [Pseudomonas fluorescens]